VTTCAAQVSRAHARPDHGISAGRVTASGSLDLGCKRRLHPHGSTRSAAVVPGDDRDEIAAVARHDTAPRVRMISLIRASRAIQKVYQVETAFTPEKELNRPPGAQSEHRASSHG
jgi:hypothetical protein